MNLYLCTTGFSDFYVVAEHPTQAVNALKKMFDDQNYGSSDNRKTTKIELLADGIKDSGISKGKPFLSSGNKLLIVSEWPFLNE